jgi:cell division GTPase FtsZ
MSGPSSLHQRRDGAKVNVVAVIRPAMKTVLIGVGQAGGKITTALAEFDDRMGFRAVRDALVVNSARADFQGLPLETVLVGQDRVKGHGVGGDNELGAEVMQSDATEVMESVSEKVDASTEAIFVVSGLGGGTGSGGAPVLVKELKAVYDVPVYAIGILPGRGEGAMYQVNAARSLKTLAREADSVIVIDNDAWHGSGDSLEEGFGQINKNIAQRIGLLLAAGEPLDEESFGRGNTSMEGDIGQSVVDTSEVINTLKRGGLAAVGYASSEASEDADENVNVVTSTARKALLTGTSLPNATEADAALLVVAGKPDAMSRKGVEHARSWVEDQTGSMEVRGGDFPLDSERIAALVLLSGVEGTPRVKEFMERAKQAAREQKENEQERKAKQQDRKTLFQNDQLDDLM